MELTNAELKDLSRAMSHALRHEPWVYELELDEEGWTSTERLLSALRKQKSKWRNVTERDFVRLMESATKQRYEMADGRIRAFYGHSVTGLLKKTPAEPPAVLYHGTSPEVVALILVEGLRPMARQFVHLSTEIVTAKEVGRRKCKVPVILRIDSPLAVQEGSCFYLGNEMVWLADRIPGSCLSVLE